MITRRCYKFERSNFVVNRLMRRLPDFNVILTQGRGKMKKVRGVLRLLKSQVLLGGPGTRPPEFFSIFSMLKHVFLHF